MNGDHITTEELTPRLREIMKPTGADLEILNNRTDDKFSQKVRNLKSHETFERLGYAEYTDGTYFINQKGERYLDENQDILKYLLINDFSYPDLVESLQTISNCKRTQEIQVFDENPIIQEGMKTITEREVYTRSNQLREYALSYYDEHGGLNCFCCGFNFTNFYGKKIGDNFIEMHHIKPIFQYQGDNLVQTIKNAVVNITPLCSNCHRMIHRYRHEPLQIQLLIQCVKENGVFIVKK
ncbi:MAG: HNH endonuclease [Treponema sp.]|jgi:predicted HNH restriction endonuclease|nr:HNH endonuclease [Treponema sp.]